MHPFGLIFAVALCVTLCRGMPAATNHTKDVEDETQTNTNATKEILKASETGDPSKVEIVKQIRRLNDDGSYTIGYEADDGTFKIESRDVLGNVKGTFGYIDKDGEIKRVTYSSSSDSTPLPMTTTTTSTKPPPTTSKVNNTVASTTRRPLATVVYPRGSYTTRGTVIQPIPRRRLVSGINRGVMMNGQDTTTESQDRRDDTTANILNLYKPKGEESVKSVRTQILKPAADLTKEDIKMKATSSTTKTLHTLKPVYEHTSEKSPEKDFNKANTIRRELTGTGSHNSHMVHLQQSVGDDSTDVYGSHLSLGTVRPLFTTTTPRPRLIPFQSIIAARPQLQQQYRDVPVVESEQETTIEASTGRIFDRQNVVTSNPIPVIHIPTHRDDGDERIYHQPIYHRPAAAVQFRTNEYMRDNPGAPIPIGNQRPVLNFEYQPQHKVLEQQQKAENPEAATASPYEIRPVTRFIPVPVDERGVPVQGYQRFVNSYGQPTQQPPAPVLLRPRVIEPFDDMNSISTPVSTRDLRRLLHILLIRQTRLQALMDQLVGPGPPYQPLYRQPDHQYNDYGVRAGTGFQNVVVPRPYPRVEDRYDYRNYDQYRQQQQQEVYNNQISNYDQPQYESQRYVPRRRMYQRPYDTAGASSTHVEDTPEFLPAEVREALLLKMLTLAISPDYMPTPVPPTELTTAAPPRKQVRNIQILGEEGSMDDMKRKMQRH